MAKELLRLDNATTSSSWNYSATRLAVASSDGTLSIFDPSSSSSLRSSFKSKVHEANIVKVVWIPPQYGDAVACITIDGIVSLCEEVAQDSQPLQWKTCKTFRCSSSKVLDVQFGSLTTLKMVAAYSDGHVRVYELLDPLELKNWQLQEKLDGLFYPLVKLYLLSKSQILMLNILIARIPNYLPRVLVDFMIFDSLSIFTSFSVSMIALINSVYLVKIKKSGLLKAS